MKKMLSYLLRHSVRGGQMAISVSILLSTINSSAQAPAWSWARSVGGTGNDQSREIVSDQNGNIYVAGFFNSPTLTMGSITLINNGGNDIFLAKYDSTGTVIWAKSVGGAGNEGALGVTIDLFGYIYIAGAYNSANLTFGTTTLPLIGGADMFIARYDPLGNPLWARSAGGSMNDEAMKVTTDGSGAAYVIGYFAGSITFGGTTLSSAGTTDGFIVKYDPSGTVLWANALSGPGGDRGEAVSVDNSGDVFVTGSFDSPSITIGTTTLANIFGQDIFIAKCDSAGTFLWAKAAGGSLADVPKDISTDLQGNVYVGGFFNSSSLSFGSITLPTAGPIDFFIAKYDGSGNILWARNVGSSGSDVLNGIFTDAAGNSYVTGTFDASLVTIGTTTLVNAGSASTKEIHVVKYDPAGTVLWALKAGGTASDFGYGICADPAGSIYITGMFESTNCFFGSTNISSVAMWDIFIAKIGAVPTGIDQLDFTGYTVIYPNPAVDKLTLLLGDITSDTEITIYNIGGEIVYKMASVREKAEISTIDFPVGIYSVKIQSEKFSQVRKFAVVK